MLHVNLEKKNIKEVSDYHCYDGKFSIPFLGEIIQQNGSYYSARKDRNRFYNVSIEKSHIAKTPLHIARWAIQEFTKTGDWVLDPTAGAGTTLIEAMLQNRNSFGCEIEFANVVRENIKYVRRKGFPQSKVEVVSGDARNIGEYLEQLGNKFQLIVNNPPYSGDENQGGDIRNKNTYNMKYNKEYSNNLAFLKESKEYWDTLEQIYINCIYWLETGGHFVIGVKDMMRRKVPYLLHEKIGNILGKHLTFIGKVLLRHYPPTLFMNTYYKRWGIHVPYYQDILIFKKGE